MVGFDWKNKLTSSTPSPSHSTKSSGTSHHSSLSLCENNRLCDKQTAKLTITFTLTTLNLKFGFLKLPFRLPVIVVLLVSLDMVVRSPVLCSSPATGRGWRQCAEGWRVAFHQQDNDRCQVCWFNHVTESSVWWNRRSTVMGKMWQRHPLAQKVLVNSGSDRREGHAPAGKTKLNPVSLNASEMMRLLHSCADLFILSPCVPFIYYVGALTFPGCQADFSQVGESNFNEPSCGDIC